MRKDGTNRFYGPRVFPLFIFLTLLAAISIFAVKARAGGSNRHPGCFIGTFLVEEGSGTESIWSLGARGVILITSSAQPLLNFSDAQGAWIRTGKLRASASSLDFSFDEDGNLLNLAKVNAVIRFRDKDCGEIEGEFSVLFYEPGVDPLDPESEPVNVLSDTFTGRRVTVEQ